jgi:predicted protein tyrosine phosphatase
MPAIYVCSLAKLEATVIQSEASHVATLISGATPVPRQGSVRVEDHLILNFNDISMPMEGMTPPGEAHIDQFLSFVKGWNRAAPLVVHCWAGVSRSTAGAMIALCALRSDLDEDDIADRIRAGSPEATPNSRMIAIADKRLERNGRLVRAAERIGRGREAFEGTVFSLTING